MIQDIPAAMEEFHRAVKAMPSTDAPDALVRLAGAMPKDVAITALARLYVLAHTRGEFDRARAVHASGTAQDGQACHHESEPSRMTVWRDGRRLL